MYSVGLDVDKFVFTLKILLYAGNSYILSPLGLIPLGIISLYIIGQSAGNFCLNLNAKAEVLNTYNKHPSLSTISEHVKNHKAPSTNEELGHFLAGLIEGNGWFSEKQLHIIFSPEDASLAYFIKKRIGYGSVYKTKEKKPVKYICKHLKGLQLILSLINGKLLSHSKYDELMNHRYHETFDIPLQLPLETIRLDNHWLAGFTQVNGRFRINVVASKIHQTGYSVGLEYSLKQMDQLPLQLLFDFLKKGNLSQESSGLWCYQSSGYKTAYELIQYFDRYNVFAGKYVSYLKFRKVYIMITEGKHLNEKGVKRIRSIAAKGAPETSTQEV